MATARALALAIIRRECGEFEESGPRDSLIGGAWLPAGRTWKATGGHSVAINFHSDRPAGWRALLDDVRQGTEVCTLTDCDTCQEA